MKFSDWVNKAVGMFRNSSDADAQTQVGRDHEEKKALSAQVGQDEKETIVAANWIRVREADIAQMESDTAVSYPDREFKRLEAQIEAWSGADIGHIQALDPMMLYDHHPHLLEMDQLRNTVPAQYRGQVYQAPSEPSDHVEAMTNSLASMTLGATIIAIDKNAQALVHHYCCDNYLDAEGWHFQSMPKNQALELIDNYRASHDLVNSFGDANGRLPHNFDYVNLPEPTAQLAKSGQTYSGPIQSVGRHHVIQIDMTNERAVRHELRALVGATLAAGDVAEVRYPQGPVGLVSLQGDAQPQSAELDHSRGVNRNQTQREFGR